MSEIKGIRTIVYGDDNLQLGCVKSALELLGIDVSAPWLAGCTGHGFIISITTGICPSTPWNALAEHYRSGEMTKLGQNLGYELEYLCAESEDPQVEARRRKAFARAKEAIDSNLPCYVYENFHYQMLARHDEEGLYTVKGQGPISFGGKEGFEVCIIRRGKPASDRAALRAGIEFALAYLASGAPQGEHAADAHHAHGPAAWDRWIAHVEKGDPGNMWRAAPAWHGCRNLAAKCMAEAQTRIPEAEMVALFGQAHAAYGEVAGHLKPVADKFTGATFNDHKEWLQDKPTRDEVLRRLRAAKAADEKAARLLTTIAAAL